MCSWSQDLAHRLDEAQRGGVGFQNEGHRGGREQRHKGADAPPNEEPSPRAAKLTAFPLWSRALLQILDRLVDDVPIDAALLIGVSEEEAVIADRIDDTWNAARIGGNAIHSRVGEQTQISCARDAKPGPDVGSGLFQRQGWDLAPQSDTLLELPSLGQVQPRFELWLAHQQDLQELAG